MSGSDISPQDLNKRMEEGKPVALLDVREPTEADICQIEGSVLIPLRELPLRFGELDPQAEYVVYCKVGTRSARAVEYLISHGFLHVRNLQGGIIRWAREIDPSLAQY